MPNSRRCLSVQSIAPRTPCTVPSPCASRTRVLDAHGDGTVHGVLGAIDWTLKHRREFGIRVMNLSFGATQRTSYQSDILAAAESVWFSGVVVVAAAGNDGPQDGTIG